MLYVVAVSTLYNAAIRLGIVLLFNVRRIVGHEDARALVNLTSGILNGNALEGDLLNVFKLGVNRYKLLRYC